MHPLVKLAKDTIEKFVMEGVVGPPPAELSREMRQRAGVFVSIKKKGHLRGCIGTFSPVEKNVAAEVIRNAVSSASMDPRFPPVDSSELPGLEYSVDVLSPPERVEDPDALDPGRYGVIIKKGDLCGLLLPDLEGVDTVDEQIEIAARKAGISSREGAELYRFTVTRYR